MGMGNLVRLAVVVCAAVAALASASAPKSHTFEKSMRTDGTFDQTWSAVIEVFADRNWAIQNMEKDSGLITTDWMSLGSDSSFADCGGSGIASVAKREIRFNVLVREEESGARITVNATFRELRTFDNQVAYVDCTSTGNVEQLVHELVETSLASRSRRPAPSPKPSPSPVEPEAPVAPLPADVAPTGTNGGACYGNQTCNAGMECSTAGLCTTPE